MERIEAKTDVLNLRARKALIKIGMTEEGILRSFNISILNEKLRVRLGTIF
ncbi:GNAT family protein [Candidatus Rhabdochlamydia sp. T3358]|uniref:GNAT family N-acetyltransferase n=1 Tax=Candidatus Rhabdochlamydia sp. T3358 TaxID=2099795 RepID=UPI0010FF3931|nr:GNAT family protein [Candidatus Rhabdochlamydia sp. T3358]